MKNKKYYAVKKGKTPGIYSSWKECEEQIKGFSGQEYKSFLTEEEAQKYLDFNKEVTEIDESNFVLVAYTDGSFDPQTEDIFKAGGVIIKENKIIKKISYKYKEKRWMSSNNIAGEIAAVMEVILWAIKNNYKNILIYVDYEGIIKWSNNEWLAKENISKDFKYFLNEYKKDIIIKFKKVKSHSNNLFNDLADSLAKQGKDFKSASDLINRMYNYVNPFEIDKYIETAITKKFKTLELVNRNNNKIKEEFILKDTVSNDEFTFSISKNGLFTMYQEKEENIKKQGFKFKEYIDKNFSQEIKRKNKIISIKTNIISFEEILKILENYNFNKIDNKQINVKDASDNKLTINFYKNSLVIQGGLTSLFIEVVFLLINYFKNILLDQEIINIIENIIDEFDYEQKENTDFDSDIELLENIPDSLKELIRQTPKLIVIIRNYDDNFKDYCFILTSTFRVLETLIADFIMKKSSKKPPLLIKKDGWIKFNIFNKNKEGERIITDKTISEDNSLLIIEGYNLYKEYRNSYLHGNLLPDNLKKINSLEEVENIFNKILEWIKKINDKI
ncbi:ribonuclease H family protein [Spiroplasma endosymbiont of Atherix ibis]|uniref:ribonuclease H family protein n=1 Tax=Spiroplasma endosymbiont of Atherix ibis TaxID=3066291 RepID=UPI0030CBE89A